MLFDGNIPCGMIVLLLLRIISVWLFFTISSTRSGRGCGGDGWRWFFSFRSRRRRRSISTTITTFGLRVEVGGYIIVFHPGRPWSYWGRKRIQFQFQHFRLQFFENLPVWRVCRRFALKSGDLLLLLLFHFDTFDRIVSVHFQERAKVVNVGV